MQYIMQFSYLSQLKSRIFTPDALSIILQQQYLKINYCPCSISFKYIFIYFNILTSRVYTYLSFLQADKLILEIFEL